MHIVHVEARLEGAEHALQRTAPVLVGEGMPVALDTVPEAAFGEHGNEAAVPVEDRAAGIERQHLDRLHVGALSFRGPAPPAP
jgi:hypothetical protein